MVRDDGVVEGLDEVVDDVLGWLYRLDHLPDLLFHVDCDEGDAGDHAEVDLEDLGLGVGRHAHGGHGDHGEDDLVVALVLVEDAHEDEHVDETLLALSWSVSLHGDHDVDEVDEVHDFLSRSLVKYDGHGSSNLVTSLMMMK